MTAADPEYEKLLDVLRAEVNAKFPDLEAAAPMASQPANTAHDRVDAVLAVLASGRTLHTEGRNVGVFHSKTGNVDDENNCDPAIFRLLVKSGLVEIDPDGFSLYGTRKGMQFYRISEQGFDRLAVLTAQKANSISAPASRGDEPNTAQKADITASSQKKVFSVLEEIMHRDTDSEGIKNATEVLLDGAVPSLEDQIGTIVKQLEQDGCYTNANKLGRQIGRLRNTIGAFNDSDILGLCEIIRRTVGYGAGYVLYSQTGVGCSVDDNAATSTHLWRGSERKKTKQKISQGLSWWKRGL